MGFAVAGLITPYLFVGLSLMYFDGSNFGVEVHKGALAVPYKGLFAVFGFCLSGYWEAAILEWSVCSRLRLLI